MTKDYETGTLESKRGIIGRKVVYNDLWFAEVIGEEHRKVWYGEKHTWILLVEELGLRSIKNHTSIVLLPAEQGD